MTKMYYNVFMDKIIIAIGGGEIREKETAEIDEQIASLAKKHAGDKRANALFIGTASHDSMPYYNSFHKTYTGLFGLKTDCVLTVYGEMNDEKIRGTDAAHPVCAVVFLSSLTGESRSPLLL